MQIHKKEGKGRKREVEGKEEKPNERKKRKKETKRNMSNNKKRQNRKTKTGKNTHMALGENVALVLGVRWRTRSQTIS